MAFEDIASSCCRWLALGLGCVPMAAALGPAGRALLANSDLIIEALAIAACTWLAWSAFVEEPEQ